MITQEINRIKLKSNLIKKLEVRIPKLIFSPTQQEENINPILGIRRYGPYDSNTSEEVFKRDFKGVELFVFCPEGDEKVFNGLFKLSEIIDNGYERKPKFDTDFNGFKDEFKLKILNTPEPSDIISYKVGKLLEVLDEYKETFNEVFERGNRPIAIIGGSSHRSTSIRREQYIEAKREFTSLDIPSQYASYYEIEESGYGILYQILRNKPIGYSIWNFALNLYGKIGGIAWIVQQSLFDIVKKIMDLSIGIRFGRLRGKRGYVFGHATILDRFGRFIGTVSQTYKFSGMVVPTEIMKSFIIQTIEKALSDPRIKDIYNKKEYLNIAFHRLNYFHPQEILGIQQGLDRILKKTNLEKINFNLIFLISRKTFVVFDEIAEFNNPKYGLSLSINENTAIIHTAGARSDRDRGPLKYPVIASCQNLGEKNSVLQNLKSLCSHILDVSALHWQTVIPSSVRLPATLEFAKRIANFAAYNIQPSQDSWLEKTLWFV